MNARAVTHAALITIGALGVAGIAAELVFNPLRRPKEKIQEWVLEKTPVGSSRQHVLAVIQREGWAGHPEFRGVVPKEAPRGISFYGADLGSYQGLPWRCRADAFWGFDANDRVIDLYVSSWCEGI